MFRAFCGDGRSPVDTPDYANKNEIRNFDCQNIKFS